MQKPQGESVGSCLSGRGMTWKEYHAISRTATIGVVGIDIT